MFGGLKGLAGEWDAVAQAYGKGNLGLAEAGLGLVQCTDYEVPHQRRQLAKFRQQLRDLDRREGEYTKLAAASRRRFTDECAAVGIAGRSVESELGALRGELPATFEGVAAGLRKGAGERALGYLGAFLAHTEVPFNAEAAFPALREIQNASQDAAAAQAWARKQDGEKEEAGGGGPEICWDLADDGGLAGGEGAADSPAEPAGIDWDFDVAEAGGNGVADAAEGEAAAPVVEVDWDLGAEVEGGAGGEAPAAVNWDIEMEAGEGAAEGEDLEVVWDLGDGQADADAAGGVGGLAVVTEAGGEGGAARPGVQLNDPDFRARLLDDLYELQAFLAQRVSEAAACGPGAPAEVEAETPESLGELQTWATEAIDALTCKRTTLLLMLGRPRFMERTVRGLEHARSQEGKYGELLKELEGKRREAQANIVASAAKVEFLLRRLRALKADAEQQISVLYKGRPVNVLGKINSVLAEE